MNNGEDKEGTRTIGAGTGSAMGDDNTHTALKDPTTTFTNPHITSLNTSNPLLTPSEVHMASPPNSPLKDLQGASYMTGGIF